MLKLWLALAKSLTWGALNKIHIKKRLKIQSVPTNVPVIDSDLKYNTQPLKIKKIMIELF
jgi:hypothetical protein